MSSRQSNIHDFICDIILLYNYVIFNSNLHFNFYFHLSHHQCLQPEAGLQCSGAPGLLQLKEFTPLQLLHHRGRNKWRKQWEIEVNKNATGGQMLCEKSIWFFRGCSEEDHSGPWHLKTALLIPESPSTAPDQEADPDEEGWGWVGVNECMWLWCWIWMHFRKAHHMHLSLSG